MKTPDSDIVAIVTALRLARRLAKLSQADVAGASGLTRRTVIHIEQLDRMPRSRSLARYARGLGYRLVVMDNTAGVTAK